MNLGVVITHEERGAVAMDLLEAADLRGWNLRCFLTGTAIRLFREPRLVNYSSNHWVALCELSLDRNKVDVAMVKAEAPDIIIGGQYQDAELVKNSDRVLVF